MACARGRVELADAKPLSQFWEGGMFAPTLITSMESTRLIRAGYWLAAILVLFSIANWVASIWPMHPDQVRWRFGAVGALSNVALTPLLGLFLALTLAVVFNHGRVARTLGWICMILTACMVLLVLGFTLDFLQTRALSDPRLHHTIDIASSLAILKQIGIIIAFALLGLMGIRHSRSVSPRPSRGKKDIVLIPGSNAPPN